MKKKIFTNILYIMFSVGILVALLAPKIFKLTAATNSNVKNIARKSIADEKSNIFDRVSNETKINDLITKEYSKIEILNYIQYNTTIEDVNLHFPIECLRKVGDKYYSVHLLKEGGAFYALYYFDTEKNTYRVKDFWLYNNPIYKKQFDTVVVGKSTFDDIHNIDKDCGAGELNSGIVSFHRTIDGYLVKINYKENQQKLIVSDLYIEHLNNSFVNGNLLPMDLPPKFGK